MAIGPKLLGALKTIGGTELMGAATKAAGAGLINMIEQKTGLKVSDDEFDEAAGAYALANQDRILEHKEIIAANELEQKKLIVGDVQHARDAALSARERLSIEHQQKVDLINLYESLFMSIGGLVFVIAAITGLVYATASKSVDIDEWLQVLIVATITWLTKDLISQRSTFKWGSTEGSKDKNTIIEDVLQRAHEDDDRRPSPQALPPSISTATRPTVEQAEQIDDMGGMAPPHEDAEPVGVETYEDIELSDMRPMR